MFHAFSSLKRAHKYEETESKWIIKFGRIEAAGFPLFLSFFLNGKTFCYDRFWHCYYFNAWFLQYINRFLNSLHLFCFFLIFQKQAVGLICSFIWAFLLYRLHQIFSFFLPKEIKWTFKIIFVPVIHFKNCAQCKINKFVEVLFGDFNVKRRTLQIRGFCSKILLRAHISQHYVCGSHV